MKDALTDMVVIVLGLLLAAAVLVILWQRGDNAIAKAAAEQAVRERNDAADALAYAQRTLEHERKQAEAMAGIGQAHEEDRTDAEAVPAAVVAALDDGSLQLRKHWAACETARVSEASLAATERDALSALRKQDQADLVRVGRDADDHVRACQAVVREYAAAGLTIRDGAKP